MPANDSFRANRWIRTLNLVLQAVLFLTFFGGLNYLARSFPSWRFDLTQHRKFSLSPETLSYIKNLERPVRIVVTPGDDSVPEVRGLLEEFRIATETSTRGPISVEYLDIYQNRKVAEELGIDQTGLVVLIAGNNRRSLTLNDFYTIEAEKRVAFQGEQTLTAAVLNVTERERKKVYFLVGHGELQPTDTNARVGLSRAREQLRHRNYDVDTLDLAVARAIPADASVLVAVAPTEGAYTSREQELLRKYMADDAGRLILFLGPGRSADEIGLADLLFDWGIFLDDDRVWEPDPAHVTEDFDLAISAFDGAHPITQGLFNNNLKLYLGATRTVRPARASGLTVVPVAATSTTAWGEVDYRRAVYQLDEKDIRPMRGIAPEDRLGVIVASERVAMRQDLPFSVRGGRLVVFGTGDLPSNQRIGTGGNFMAFLGAINWCVDRDRLLSVAPRPLESFSLTLTAQQFERLRFALLLGLPGAIFLLGAVVYWSRRT